MEVKLQVNEAVQDDVNRGIVRLDSQAMKKIGVFPGDVVEVEGKRKTVAVVDRAYPGDTGLSTVRMDGITRRNSQTSIGETVLIRKADVCEAKKIVIAPAKKGVRISDSRPETIKPHLINRPMVKGDLLSLGRFKQFHSTLYVDRMFSPYDQPRSVYGWTSDVKFVIVNTNPKQAVSVSENTEIEIKPEAVDLSEASSLEITYEDVGGLSGEVSKIREMVELPLKHPELFERLGIEAPKGVLLHGPPGTGKTLLAKAVASETNSNFILINGPEIMSKYYGQSEENLRRKFEDAEKNAPSIIFIDEIDAIASKREETRGEVERRVVAQLLSLMDGLKSRGKVVVIAATNRPNALDPALRRPGRFDREIEIGVPNRKGRLDILKIHTRNMPLAKNVNLNEIANVTHGFVGADLSALTKEAAMIVLRRLLPEIKMDDSSELPPEIFEKLMIYHKDLKETLKVVRPSAMREVFVESPNVRWRQIGGLVDVKQQLIEAVEWPLKDPKMFKRLGITPPRGILLYGAPGTGKTLLAKAVATESNANFILVNGPSLLSKWVGESEKAVREIFRKAKQTSPSIIFFDEIDALAPKRGMSQDNNVTERIVNQLLTELDGLQSLHDVIIMAATNRPDMLDTALLRPGRFDRIIMTSAPDEEARKKILEIHMSSMPLDDDVIVKEIAELSKGYTGADLEAVCREAAMKALREDYKASKISMNHFKCALGRVVPSITSDIEESYKDLQAFFSTARAREMQESKPHYLG